MNGRQWLERIWRRAQAKREAEHRRARDTVLQAAKRAHACTVDEGPTMCGFPLDENGLCEVHK